MPSTSTYGITYPDASSNITPLELHFKNLADTSDSAIVSAVANIKGATPGTSTITSLKTAIDAINTRVELDFTNGAGAPSVAPAGSDKDGSLYWDGANNNLYLYDTINGWKIVWKMDTVTLTSGVVNAISGWDNLSGVSYTERNGMVHLSFQVLRNGTTIGAGNISNVNIATITSGYLPLNSVSWSSGASGYCQGYVNTSGTVVITASGSDITDNSAIDVHLTYIKA